MAKCNDGIVHYIGFEKTSDGLAIILQLLTIFTK